MSLVTRCPACGTHFKIVRDQLRISDGWVRCGRCSQVFDAPLDLRETPDGVAEPAPQADLAADNALLPRPPALRWPSRDLLDLTAPSVDQSPPLHPDVLSRGLIADEPWPSSTPVAADAADAVDAADAAPDLPAVDIQLQKALRRARVKAAKIAKARDKKGAIAAASAPVPLAEPTPRAEPTPQAEPAPPPLPSFLDSAASRWRWRPGGAMRPRALVAMALLAALLLVLQVLRHERDVLAAREPGLAPLLAQLCALSGCQLAAPRRIGSITIDGAAFARERGGDGYRLSFTLRNDAAMPLAMPAIELSLLDTQERAVVRRVIGPVEFGAPAVLGANAERAASLALNLSGAEVAALPPVAGYRLVAFYP